MGASAKTIDRNAAIASALRTVATERTGLAALSDALGDGLAERFADAVETLAGKRLTPLQEWIERRGFWAVLYARIAPGVPYSLVNYAAGLTRVGLPAFAAATAIGAAPRAFAYTALGGSLDDLNSPEAIIAIVALVVMALTGLVLLRAERARDRAGAGAGGI